MPPSIACAKAGVTTGEWGLALRQAFGEYRAPTGVGTAMRNDAEGLDDIRAEVDRVSKKLGRRLKLLVGKPGLDGHSNGAEQIAVARPRCRHGCGLRRHPPHTRGHCRCGGRESAHMWSDCRSCPARTCRSLHEVIARLKEAGVDGRAGRRRRHHPAAGCARAQRSRRRRGLYAEGFRAEPHHERSGAASPKVARRQQRRMRRNDTASKRNGVIRSQDVANQAVKPSLILFFFRRPARPHRPPALHTRRRVRAAAHSANIPASYGPRVWMPNASRVATRGR